MISDQWLVVSEKRGFTFVELLIAATMMSVLFVGLGSHLRGGIIVWRRATSTTETLQRQRVALQRLEQDLANTFEYGAPDGVPALVFGSQDLQVTTLGPQFGYGYLARVVAYQCGEAEGRHGLLRRSQSLGEARAGLAPTPQVLLPACEQMSVRYAYASSAGAGPLEWRDQWLFPDEVPRHLEVSLRVSPGRQLQRVVTIPIGVLKPITEDAG